MKDLLVYNIEAASPTMVRSLHRHCRDRVPDGASAIDRSRSNLNEVLLGRRDVLESLEAFYQGGVQRPAKQAEAPYLRIVISASASYFRPDAPDAIGTWDQDRLDAWVYTTVAQLRDEHGDDLVHVELHLDEDTPHLHGIVAPTYMRKPRRPGRPKRGETTEQFEARKLAAVTADGVRTVGRASHATLSKEGSFVGLRRRMAAAVANLGIGYGQERQVDAPAGKTTRQWVKEQSETLAEARAKLDEELMAAHMDREAARLDREAAALDRAAAARERRLQEGRRAGIDGLELAARQRYEKNEVARRQLVKIAKAIGQLGAQILRMLGKEATGKIHTDLSEISKALDAVRIPITPPMPTPSSVLHQDGQSSSDHGPGF